MFSAEPYVEFAHNLSQEALDAGLDIIIGFDPEWDNSEEAVAQIYIAMKEIDAPTES